MGDGVPASGRPRTGGRGQWLGAATGAGGVAVPDFVRHEWTFYARSARRSRISYQALEVTAVVLAAAVPVSVALRARPAVAAVLGAALVVLGGVRQVFDWHEGWLRFARAREAIEWEVARFLVGADAYADPERAAQHLVCRVNDLVRDDITQWEARRRTVGGPPVVER